MCVCMMWCDVMLVHDTHTALKTNAKYRRIPIWTLIFKQQQIKIIKSHTKKKQLNQKRGRFSSITTSFPIFKGSKMPYFCSYYNKYWYTPPTIPYKMLCTLTPTKIKLSSFDSLSLIPKAKQRVFSVGPFRIAKLYSGSRYVNMETDMLLLRHTISDGSWRWLE